MSSGKAKKRAPVDATAVAEAMSAGKAKKLARAQGIINSIGYVAATTMIRACSLLPFWRWNPDLRGPPLPFHDLLALALEVVDNPPPMVIIPLDAFPWMEAMVSAYVAGCEACHFQPREHRWQSTRQRITPPVVRYGATFGAAHRDLR